MSGALKAGSVYVAVSAAVGDFSRTMESLARMVEQTAKRVKESAKAVADVGQLFAAGMAGAVLASAASNRAVQADLEKLKAYLYTLAADIGDAFAPFLQQLTQAVGSLVGAFQRLSPEVKAGLAHFVVFMAATGAGASVLSKGAGLAEGLAKATGAVLVPALNAASSAAKLMGEATAAAFPKLAAAVNGMSGGMLKGLGQVVLGLGGVLAPLAAVAAAVAGIALLAGTLYEAWNDSTSGLKELVGELWGALKDVGQHVADTYLGILDTLKNLIAKGLAFVMTGVANTLKNVSKLLAPLARGAGMTGLASALEDLQQLTGERLMNELATGANLVADKAREGAKALVEGAQAIGSGVAESVSYGLNYATKGLKRAAVDSGLANLPERLKAELAGMLGGPAGRTRSPTALKDAEGREKEMAALQKEANEASRDEYLKSIQAESRAAAEAFSQLFKDAQEAAADAQRELERAAEEAAARVRSAREAMRSRIYSALGELANLINAFKDGFAAGGIWGGIAAAAVELISKSEEFKGAMEVVMGGLQMLADTLGKLLQPLQPLIAVLFNIINTLLEGLQPLFDMLNDALEPIIPPLVMIGQLMEALGPALNVVNGAMLALQFPMKFLAGPVMKGLFEVLKFVSVVILTIVKAVGGVWNGIVGAIQSVLRTIGNFSIFGKKPLGFLTKWADGLDSAKVDTEELAASIKELNGLTWEQANAKAKEMAETLKNTAAVKKATEALSNVPQAWKVALARFDVQDAQAPGPMAPGAQSGQGNYWQRPGESIGNATPQVVNHYEVTITASNPQQAMAEWERTADRMAYQQTGSRGRAGRYAMPAAP